MQVAADPEHPNILAPPPPQSYAYAYKILWRQQGEREVEELQLVGAKLS
jgi:hypothetical protein